MPLEAVRVRRGGSKEEPPMPLQTASRLQTGSPVTGPWPPAKSAVSGSACPSPAPVLERDLYSIVEVAGRCGRSRGWVHKQIDRGLLRAFHVGRAYMVRRLDLDAFLNGLEEV
jgi:hypothetical protein